VWMSTCSPLFGSISCTLSWRVSAGDQRERAGVDVGLDDERVAGRIAAVIDGVGSALANAGSGAACVLIAAAAWHPAAVAVDARSDDQHCEVRILTS